MAKRIMGMTFLAALVISGFMLLTAAIPSARTLMEAEASVERTFVSKNGQVTELHLNPDLTEKEFGNRIYTNANGDTVEVTPRYKRGAYYTGGEAVVTVNGHTVTYTANEWQWK